MLRYLDENIVSNCLNVCVFANDVRQSPLFYLVQHSPSEWPNNKTRPSALGMSDPVIESQEIKETQEFPSIQNVEGGEEDERGEGSEGDDEKR